MITRRSLQLSPVCTLVASSKKLILPNGAASPEKTLGSQGGKINYGFDSPTLERDDDDVRFSSTSSTNSEELVDDFGDPIKPSSKSSKGSKQSFSRTITRQSTDSDDEDDDGWTTEF